MNYKAFFLALTFVITSCGGVDSYKIPSTPAATSSISLSSETGSAGESVTVTWSSTNATSCVASNAWTGTKGTSGSETFTPDTAGSYTFEISCSSSGGTGTASVTYAVSSQRLFQTRVIDGYISGANVYIDFNMNLTQDEFEPSALEDTTNKTYYWEEDAFSNIPNFNEECEGNRPYIAEVPVGAVDEVRGTVESAFNLYYFPYLTYQENKRGNQEVVTTEQGARTNVTPFTTLFLSFIQDELGTINLTQDNVCSQTALDATDEVRREVEQVINTLSNKFDVNVYTFYDDYFLSENETMQSQGEKIVDFLITGFKVSNLLENHYQVEMTTSIDKLIIDKILGNEDFATAEFALFSSKVNELTSDGYWSTTLYAFYDVVANAQGQLLDADGNVYELTLSNLQTNTDFQIREQLMSEQTIFGVNKVLFETNGDTQHIDIGTFILDDSLTRISISPSERLVYKTYTHGLKVTITNDANPYFDYDFENLFLSRDAATVESIYNEVVALSDTMSDITNNQYLLYAGDEQKLDNNGDYQYIERYEGTIVEYCTYLPTNTVTTGVEGYNLCLENL